MGQPSGCCKVRSPVVRLCRSIHGLKQAGWCWQSLLLRQLGGFGLEQCPADPCTFRMIGKDGRVRMMLAVHGDDMIVAGSSADCYGLYKHLNKRVQTKHLGGLTHYTGCSFKSDQQNKSITVPQKAYVDRLLKPLKISKTSPLPAAPCADAPFSEQ